MTTEKLSAKRLIVMGFFLGIGFAIPTTLIGYLPMLFVDDWFTMEMEDIVCEHEDETFVAEESGLVVQIQTNRASVGGWLFLGTLSNTGEQSYGNADIELELFDESGAFIDETPAFVTGGITPQTTHNFKVEFYSGTEQPLRFADYTVKVVSAY